MKAKKILSAISAVVLGCSSAFMSAACGGGGEKPDNSNVVGDMTSAYNVPQDYCRTYYEVFVRSFADGDDDGIGDFRGLIDNLDYLNDGDEETDTDLGINGIWMMPINQSPSYHKYDVEDYYDVDDEYGTLDDFKELVEECEKRDIWLQMDLVLNHTSNRHEWFEAALEAARRGNDVNTDPDLSKYCFVRAAEKPVGPGEAKWQKVSDTADYYYLCNFSTDMPDLNLKNQEVRDEIKNIVDYWLDLGIKSFRLDAVPWACAYTTSYNEDNREFWTWFNNYCHAKGAEVAAANGWADDNIKRYCYNVGEVWSGTSTVINYYNTGMSNFNYGLGASATDGFMGAARGVMSTEALMCSLQSIQSQVLEKNDYALLSNFLSNHDNNRSGGTLANDVNIKKAAGLYLLAPGNPYIYYGEEIGAFGSGKDENKRLAFNWGDWSKQTTDPDDANYSQAQRYGTVKRQTKDENSILSYYRQAIKLRNRFPEIGRGVITPYALDKKGKLTVSSELRAANDLKATDSVTPINELNKNIAAYKLTYGDSDVVIVQNLWDKSVTIKADVLKGYKIVGELKANGGSTRFSKSNSLILDAATVVVLKK
ncbi:MAG: alpha-amylase [Clostridiales bacterium]|nr:alpha-amylase [Clostridiales bacterium]